MIVELRKSFTNYGPNKHRSCKWVVSHLRITDFYALYDETNGPYHLFLSTVLKPAQFVHPRGAFAQLLHRCDISLRFLMNILLSLLQHNSCCFDNLIVLPWGVCLHLLSPTYLKIPYVSIDSAYCLHLVTSTLSHQMWESMQI